MAKKVTGYIKLQIPAGKATPAPPSRTGSWSARREHRTVYEGVQRKNCRSGRYDHSGSYYRICRQKLQLHHQRLRRQQFC